MNEGHYIFDYSQEFIHKLEVGLLSRVMGQVLLFLIGGGKVQEGGGAIYHGLRTTNHFNKKPYHFL